MSGQQKYTGVVPLDLKSVPAANARNDLDAECRGARGRLPAVATNKFFAIETSSEGSGSSHVALEGHHERCLAGGGACHSDDVSLSLLKELAFTSSSESSEGVPVSPTRADDVPLDNMDDAVEREKRGLPVCDQNHGPFLDSGLKEEESPDRHLPQAPLAVPLESTSVDCGEKRKLVEASETLFFPTQHVPAGGPMQCSRCLPQGRKDCLVELYYRGVTTRRRLEEKWATIRAARENAFKAYSFQPKITNKAKAIPRRGKIPGCYEHDKHLRQRLILEAWKSESDGQCQPTPTISKGSERIVRRVRGNSAPVIPVEERLHLDSDRRRCRMEEEAVKQQIYWVKRTPGDIKAHIDRLYMCEVNRQFALQKLREEVDAGRRQAPLHVSGADVVRRLARPLERTRRGRCMDEEKQPFAPQLFSGTDELRRRARRRRVDAWYLFFTQRRHEGAFPPNAIAEKIREALEHADLSGNFSRAAFGSALDEYEKRHGTQSWHSTPPPAAPALNEELTFAPKVNPRRSSQESAQAAHERLFSAVRKQQLTIQAEEARVRLEAALDEERRKQKQQRQQRQARALSNKKMKLLESPSSAEEEGRRPPLSLLPSETPQSIADDACVCESFIVSPTSDTSASLDSMPVLVELPTMSAFSHVLVAAQQLQSLLDAAEGREEKEGVSSVSPRQEAAPFAEHTRPVVIADTPQVANTRPEPSVSRGCGSQRSAVKNMRVSTDLLLECALSRLTWSADVATRRREWSEGRRRLQGVGKMLYQKM
ncbi:uncharacterized protein Tco025E_06496 [Trypanosoma conorhini]|uniref:Uncharacterized protein n=1 Tax=Trypanosoma conorhini TaxID=83891 RepID=A0A422P347_9TRYP|nr:uncharacterized protein Tco025E_06496 [Trypanosoma conorhini]RNF12156.1 hypothetical protein Tco025E_06496 [Trypanosoma conorhini]